jgi:hypothetical protein
MYVQRFISLPHFRPSIIKQISITNSLEMTPLILLRSYVYFELYLLYTHKVQQTFQDRTYPYFNVDLKCQVILQDKFTERGHHKLSCQSIFFDDILGTETPDILGCLVLPLSRS